MAATITPLLGFAVLTPFYDLAIRLITRETAWRTRLVERIGAQSGETILDVGSGTGTLAIAIGATTPGCSVQGIDPDPAAVKIATDKAIRLNSKALFTHGWFGDDTAPIAPHVDKISCSLVLHQVPLAEKRRLLRAMFDRLKPEGQLFIADYGLQPTFAMRLAFRLTVQIIDGTTNTQSNADGILPLLMEEASFEGIGLIDEFDTITGSIQILTARKPSNASVDQVV